MGESRELGKKMDSMLNHHCSVLSLYFPTINPKCHPSCLCARGLAGTESPNRLRKGPASLLFLQLWPLVLQVADFQTALDFLSDLAAWPNDVFTCLLISSVSLFFFLLTFLSWNTVGEMLKTDRVSHQDEGQPELFLLYVLRALRYT